MTLYLPRKTLNQNTAAAAGAATQPLIDDIQKQYQQAVNPQPEPQEPAQPSWSLPSLESLGVADAPSAVMSAIGAMPQRAQEAATQVADTAMSWAMPSLESLGVSGPKTVTPNAQPSGGEDVSFPSSSPSAAPAGGEYAASPPAPTAGEPGGPPLAPGAVYDPKTPGAPTDPTSWDARAHAAAVKAGHPNPREFVEQMRWESGDFDPDVVSGKRASSAGAQGVAQIMPEVARSAGVNPLDPDAALSYAATRMAQNYRKYGNSDQALAEYNMGAGNLERYGPRGLPETNSYIDIIGERTRGGATPTGGPVQGPQPNTPEPAEQTPAAQAQAYSAGSYTPNQISAATAEGLDYETALAVCGPAAAIAFARKNGRNPSMQEALGLAREVGWTADRGMAGPASQKQLLDRLGVASRLVDGAPDWSAVAADVQRGNPVTISTPGHYFVAERFDPTSGAFDFGESARVLKASGGKRWFKPEDLASLGMGEARATLFIDNPESPTPSAVAGPSALTVGSSPPPAASPSDPPAGAVAPPGAGLGDLMLRGPLQPYDPEVTPTGEQPWASPSNTAPSDVGLSVPSNAMTTPMSAGSATSSITDPTISDQNYTQAPWTQGMTPEPLGPEIPHPTAIQAVQAAREETEEELAPRPSGPGVLGTLYNAGEKAVEAGIAASGPPQTPMEVAQNALPSARGQRIVMDAIDAFGTEVGRQVAASLGYTDEEMFSVFGMPISAQNVGGFAGSVLLDPTNLVPGGQVAPIGRVGMRAAQEGLEAAGRGARSVGEGALRVGRELGEEAAYQLMDLAPSPRVIQSGGGGVPNGPLRGERPTREIEQALVSDYGRKYPDIKGRIEGTYEQSMGTPSAEYLRDSRYPRDAVHPDIADNVTGPLDQPPNMAGRMNATPGIAPRTGASILEQAAADAGSALGSSVFGASAGLAAPAETDEERAQNARIGAAIGFFGGPIASRAIRSRGGALATPGFGPRDTPGLGNVPPSQLHEPVLPGFEPPYRRPDLAGISDTPNRPRLPGEDPAGNQSELFETSGLIPPLQRGPQDPRPPGWNPSKVSDAIRQAQEEARVKADNGEALSPLEWVRRLAGEVGYSSMIGPATFTVNLTGNVLEPLWAIPKEAVRAVARGAPGEAFQMAGGAFHGMRQVGSAMVDALTASGRYAPTPGHAPLSAVTSNPIGKAITTGLEAGGRVFSALPDAVFGTIAQGAGEARAAAQMATDQGLKGVQWRKYVNDLLSDVEHVKAGELPTHPGAQQVIDEGAAYAKRQTFQDELGTIGKNVRDFATLAVIPDGQGGRKPIPVLGNLITPFFNTPWNMSTRMLERTPVGVVMNSQAGKFDKAYDATLGSALLIGLAAGPVASGTITGGGPQDPEKKSEMRSQGWRPYSTLIDGVYVPNRVFGIYAPLMNAAADVHDAIVYAKDKTPGSITSDYVGRIGQQLQQQPYLQGISSIMQAIQAGQGGGLGAAAERYAASTLTRMVPYAATGRTIGAALDPNERTADQGKNVPASTTIGQMVRSGIGNRQGFEALGQGPLPIPQDVLGRPQENQQQGGKALFARTSTERPDPTIKAFMDAGVDIGFPKTTLSVDSIPIDLVPEETKRWQAYRGEILQRFGPNMTQRAFWQNPEARQAAMQDLLQQANAAADQKLLQSIGAADIRRRVTESRQKQREALFQGAP